jgi:hypothetical protein
MKMQNKETWIEQRKMYSKNKNFQMLKTSFICIALESMFHP